MTIGDMSENDAAKRPNQKTQREENCCIQLLDDDIVTRKKQMGEKQGKSCVRVEVVPLDQIPHRSDHHGFAAPSKIGSIHRRMSLHSAALSVSGIENTYN
jgi:hypothetical protein